MGCPEQGFNNGVNEVTENFKVLSNVNCCVDCVDLNCTDYKYITTSSIELVLGTESHNYYF